MCAASTFDRWQSIHLRYFQPALKFEKILSLIFIKNSQLQSVYGKSLLSVNTEDSYSYFNFSSVILSCIHAFQLGNSLQPTKLVPFTQKVIRKLLHLIESCPAFQSAPNLKSFVELIRWLLCFIPDSKSFNSTVNEIIHSLSEIDSDSMRDFGQVHDHDLEEGDRDSGPFRVSQIQNLAISQFLREKEVRSLQSIARSKIVGTLISSLRAPSLSAAVRSLRSTGSLPATIADFLLLEGGTPIC